MWEQCERIHWFWYEGGGGEGADDRVESEGLRKISRADRASSSEGFVMRGLEWRSSMNFG